MDKITKKEEAELELEEEDRELESEDEEFFDDIEEENISTKQKFLLILTGVIAFLLFVILLFPVEEILRTFLLKKFQESGLTVDFKKISLPLWGNKQIDSLYFLTSDNIELKAEEINTDISIIQLYKNKILGKLNTVSFNLDTVSLIINLRGLNFDIDLSNLEKGMLVASGEIKIQGVNGKISKMPIFPYIRDLSGTKIKSFSLDIKKIGSKLIIEKGVFNLSIAKIRLKGKVDYSGSLKTSPMEVDVCPKLSPSFAAENEFLADMLTAIGKGGEACIQIGGTLANPQPKIPDLGAGVSGGGMVENPENTNDPGAQ